MDSIVSSGIFSHGKYELDEFDITSVTVPESRVKDILVSTPSSQGILRKFNVEHRKSGTWIKDSNGVLMVTDIRMVVM